MPRRRPPVVVVLLMTVSLCILGSVEADQRPEPDRQNVDVAGSPYTIQKSDRLEAIKRYILQRLNVSEHRRFNGSTSGATPPPTPTTPSTHRRQSSPRRQSDKQLQQPAALTQTQTFSSMPEALNFYDKRVAEDGRRRRGRPRQTSSPAAVEVQRRRRRLQSVDASPEHKKRGASRPRSHRKRRRQVKLTMTADTGQIRQAGPEKSNTAVFEFPVLLDASHLQLFFVVPKYHFH